MFLARSNKKLLGVCDSVSATRFKKRAIFLQFCCCHGCCHYFSKLYSKGNKRWCYHTIWTHEGLQLHFLAIRKEKLKKQKKQPNNHNVLWSRLLVILSSIFLSSMKLPHGGLYQWEEPISMFSHDLKLWSWGRGPGTKACLNCSFCYPNRETYSLLLYWFCWSLLLLVQLSLFISSLHVPFDT